MSSSTHTNNGNSSSSNLNGKGSSNKGVKTNISNSKDQKGNTIISAKGKK
jgi:hypothetical protein